MGVGGLMGYVHGNPYLLKEHRLQSTRIVVDANNVIYCLVDHYNQERVYTGTYDDFAKAVTGFLDILRAAKVTPTFIYDGSEDIYDAKWNRLLERRTQVVQSMAKLSPNKSVRITIPPLTHMVFRRVVEEYNFPSIQCPGDGDQIAAAHANYLGCPVLSQDSDYFIFPINFGYVPFKSLCLDVDGASGIPCQLYNVENFKVHLPNLSADLLPRFAIILGNDFFPDRHLSALLTSIRAAHADKGGRIEPVLHWLHGQRAPSVDAQLRSFLEKSQLTGYEAILEREIKRYEVEALSKEDILKENRSKMLELDYPLWLVDAYERNKVEEAKVYLHIRQLPKVLLSFPLENVLEPSVHNCSKWLREIIYGLILNGHHVRPVEEYLRRGQCVIKEWAVARLDVPCLATIGHLDERDRRQAMLDLLNVNAQILDAVPAGLRLMFLSLQCCFGTENVLVKSARLIMLTIVSTIYHLAIGNERGTDPSAYRSICKLLRQKPDIESNSRKKHYLTFLQGTTQVKLSYLQLVRINELFNWPFETGDPCKLFCGTVAINIYLRIAFHGEPLQNALKLIPAGAKAYGLSWPEFYTMFNVSK